jgi:peroxiredoxin
VSPAPERGRRSRRILVLGLEILALAALIYGIHLWQTRDAPRGPAPALAGKLLDGSGFDLAQERGRPVLVHFWATWCPVCGLQDGAIAAIARDHRVVTVASQSGGTEAVRRHMDAQSLDFPVLVDPSGSVATRWGIRGVPTSFLVDRSGRIRFVATGYTSAIGLRTRLWLAGR